MTITRPIRLSNDEPAQRIVVLDAEADLAAAGPLAAMTGGGLLTWEWAVVWLRTEHRILGAPADDSDDWYEVWDVLAAERAERIASFSAAYRAAAERVAARYGIEIEVVDGWYSSPDSPADHDADLWQEIHDETTWTPAPSGDVTPVGLAEVAVLLGVQRDTVDKWQTRGVLPAPRWTVGGRPAWPWADIEDWARRTARLH